MPLLLFQMTFSASDEAELMFMWTDVTAAAVHPWPFLCLWLQQVFESCSEETLWWRVKPSVSCEEPKITGSFQTSHQILLFYQLIINKWTPVCVFLCNCGLTERWDYTAAVEYFFFFFWDRVSCPLNSVREIRPRSDDISIYSCA